MKCENICDRIYKARKIVRSNVFYAYRRKFFTSVKRILWYLLRCEIASSTRDRNSAYDSIASTSTSVAASFVNRIPVNVRGSIRLDTLRKSRVNQLHIDNIGDMLSRSEENPEEEENDEIVGGLLLLFR